MSQRRPPAPRWNTTKFGGSVELRIGSCWIGSIEPKIGGVHRYSRWNGRGDAADFDAAKQAVEAFADLSDVPMTARFRSSITADADRVPDRP